MTTMTRWMGGALALLVTVMALGVTPVVADEAPAAAPGSAPQLPAYFSGTNWSHGVNVLALPKPAKPM